MVIRHWHDHHFINCTIKNNRNNPFTSYANVRIWFYFRINCISYFFYKKSLNKKAILEI